MPPNQHVESIRNHQQETVVIKSVEGHPRVENERDVLHRLQHRTPFLRPLVDDIQEPSAPTTIALKYLDSDLLIETKKKTLNRKELRHVCRSVLEALKVIHEENLVHTGKGCVTETRGHANFFSRC
jgi:serine/threonine protein kinase